MGWNNGPLPMDWNGIVKKSWRFLNSLYNIMEKILGPRNGLGPRTPPAATPFALVPPNPPPKPPPLLVSEGAGRLSRVPSSAQLGKRS